MMNHPKHNKELAIPGYTHSPIEKSRKLTHAFQDATKVTRAYTLSRDVQDIVDAALRREKQHD